MNVLQRVGLATGIAIVSGVAALVGCTSTPKRVFAVILTPTECQHTHLNCVIHVDVAPGPGGTCVGAVREDAVTVKHKNTPVLWEIVKPIGDSENYEFAGGVGDMRFYRLTPNPPADPYFAFDSNPDPMHSLWKTTAKATASAGLRYQPVVWRTSDNVPCTIADPTISNMGG